MNRHQIKSQLAKLLATEDLVVEHKHVETASFNVHSRVLTLPMWEKASNSVYDMLVGHEVGHALYTLDENWLDRYYMNPSFFNITEDARIEKLMKRKYPGLRKSFYNGYQELFEKDFFDLKDKDVSKMGLADRVNLHFKIGNFIQVPFHNDEEVDIVKQIADTETFEESLIAAQRMYDYCNQKKEEKETEIQPPVQVPSASNDQESKNEPMVPNPIDSKQKSESDEKEQGQEQEEVEQEQIELEDNTSDDLDVKTVDGLEEKIRDLVDSNAIETFYVEIPKVDLKKVIVSNSDVHREINDWWQKTEEKCGTPDANEKLFSLVDTEFKKFKKSAQKEVGYLVKEFEMKKSADAYSRASTARTGVLDCSKLHTYKYNEDLFKKVTLLPDGKNHGLIFILDWSGSMGHVMMDTIKQLYNLIWFCKKVSIPFEVYSFTNEWIDYRYSGNLYDEDKVPGFFRIDGNFNLMNLFTHKTNSRDLEQHMINIFRIAAHFSNSTYTQPMYLYQCPNRLSLSGTPLNESLISLHQIIPQFKTQNQVQKVQCVVLTDGEANPLKYYKEFPKRQSQSGEPYIGVNSPYYNEITLRDRKLGKTYAFFGEYTQFTNVMLENLRDNFPNTNFIGIRILDGRDSGSFIRRYYGARGYYDKIAEWKKNKSLSIDGSGYQKYFGLSSTALSSDSEFEVKEDATKAQIKSAFKKSLNSKKMNKRVLGEFIDLVA
jgi:hypothetical protein